MKIAPSKSDHQICDFKLVESRIFHPLASQNSTVKSRKTKQIHDCKLNTF